MKFPLLTGYKYDNNNANDYMTLLYYQNVKNSKELLNDIINQNIPNCAIIDASLVISVKQIAAACSRALISMYHNDLKSRSLYTEVIYNLAPNQSRIDLALKQFGIKQDSSSIVIVLINAKNVDDENIIKQKVVGNECDPNQLSQNCNREQLMKMYKLSTHEKENNVIDAIVNRVSSLHCLR